MKLAETDRKRKFGSRNNTK